jgi:hypothetical protein
VQLSADRLVGVQLNSRKPAAFKRQFGDDQFEERLQFKGLVRREAAHPSAKTVEVQTQISDSAVFN